MISDLFCWEGSLRIRHMDILAALLGALIFTGVIRLALSLDYSNERGCNGKAQTDSSRQIETHVHEDREEGPQ